MRQSDEEEKRQGDSRVFGGQTRDGWIQCSNEGTGTVRIRRTTAGSVRICNVGGKIRNGSDETDCGGRTADSSDKTGRGGCKV
ncbi:MAG: hypothetical protein ACLRMX_13015 [Lachnospira eligens]